MMRRKRFELMVSERDHSRVLVGEDIGNEHCTDLFLCLPGLLETRQSFSELVEHLGPRVRVMTLDWCGRGDSEKLVDSHHYKMSTYLQDLGLFYAYAMGALSNHDRGTRPRIHLVGSSMGGLLAVCFATRKPRLLGTVILNDVGPVLPWTGVLSLMTGLSSAKTTDVKQSGTLNTSRLAEELNVDPQLIRAVQQPGHLDLPHETRLSGVDFSTAFAAVTVPMLLLRGKNSEIINNSVVNRLFELHPLTRIHECAQSGHPVAYNADVCHAILDFTAKH